MVIGAEMLRLFAEAAKQLAPDDPNTELCRFTQRFGGDRHGGNA